MIHDLMCAQLTKSLNERLIKHGFTRKGQTWNRKKDTYVDVVNLQLSNITQSFTINVGVGENIAYEIFWNETMPEHLDEPSCIVRSRIGHLVDNYDKWWAYSLNGAIEEAAGYFEMYGLSFFEKYHMYDDIRNFLKKQVRITSWSGFEPHYYIIFCILTNNIQDAVAAIKQTREKNARKIWGNKTDVLLDRLEKQLF